MKADARYSELCNLARKNALLQSTMALLEWDQQTKLPVEASDWRAEQLTYLSGELHRGETNPRIGELLEELGEVAESEPRYSDIEANIRGLKRDYLKKRKIPARLVEAMTNACSTGQQLWVAARKNNDVASFVPKLQEIFSLKQEYADAIGFDECRYDALLDDYEPGARTREVKTVLHDLKSELVPLIQQISDCTTRPDTSILTRHFPVDAQEKLGRLASAKIGFDYSRGRLDITHHPFCETMGPNDVRLTTRYDDHFFNAAFFGTLHEAGHGIYEQGLRNDQFGLPAGTYCSLGIHESQSRLWENLVGRSEAFWEYFYPQIQSEFSSLSDISLYQFWSAVNSVQPSLIRVEADEATYNLHIIIRFELEQAVFENQLEVADLADAWDDKYEEYLGIRAATHSDGVLQDVHWSAGLMGYFPTYSLGNLYASQFFEAAEKELGDLHSMFRNGNFNSLKEWLNDKIHLRGNTMPAPELGNQVTGLALSHDALVRHLKTKLTRIYDL